MENEKAMFLAHRAVSSHLRIVLRIDLPQLVKKECNNSLAHILTTTSSKPIVAKAVAELLCE
jgi:hypothetical protein